MAGFEGEHLSSVAVITLDPNVMNSIIRLSCIFLKHFDGCRISDKQTFFQIAEFLSERGFVVLRYDKRGVNSNFKLSEDNVWGNVTFDDLKQDAEKALSVLLQQTEVNTSKKATLRGHSECIRIARRIAVYNLDKVRDIVLIVLMGAVANTLKDLLYFQIVTNPMDYIEKV